MLKISIATWFEFGMSSVKTTCQRPNMDVPRSFPLAAYIHIYEKALIYVVLCLQIHKDTLCFQLYQLYAHNAAVKSLHTHTHRNLRPFLRNMTRKVVPKPKMKVEVIIIHRQRKILETSSTLGGTIFVQPFFYVAFL